MTTSVTRSPSVEESQARSNRTYRLWILLLSIVLSVVALIVFSPDGTLSTHPAEPQQLTRGKDENSLPPQRRRLMERRTLSPASRASMLLALANAKKEGKLAVEQRADPFRADPFRAELEFLQKKKPTVEKPKAVDEVALGRLRKEVDWDSIDPLSTRTSLFPDIPQLDLAKPRVEYLGVTVDAARHHFPIDWLKQLIVHLQKMNYNLIHFRLTDDERIAVRFQSHPKLTRDGDVERYSPVELTELVAFARDHGITMVPEVNLPLRAASWAGIPGLIVACPNSLCEDAHSIPLNLEHPEIATIVHDILKEVIEIFDSPRMLHLGGTMSIHDADGCLEEAGLAGTERYFRKFEEMLKDILKKLPYPEAQVIRFESVESVGAEETMGKHVPALVRIGGIRHYWMSLPDASDSQTQSIVTSEVQLGTDNDESAAGFYTKAIEITNLEMKPRAIVVGTMSMSPDAWITRNALARLLAISMGASVSAEEAKSQSKLLEEFASKYDTNCQQLLGKGSAFCQLKGHTARKNYLTHLAEEHKAWKKAICSRLTDGSTRRVFQPYIPDRNYASSMGNYVFWKTFHRPPDAYTPKFSKDGSIKKSPIQEVKNLQHTVEKAGVIFDLANSLVSVGELENLLVTYVAPLGLNTLQLRLSDDFAFAVHLGNNTRLSQSTWADELLIPIPTLKEMKQLVDAASEWDIEVFPEISINTNAGGWVNGGFLVHCPKLYCEEGSWIPNDIREPMFLPLVYAVLWELRKTFGGSSPYMHLGADERVENLRCFEEAGLKEDEDPPFGAFEVKLGKLLGMLGIQHEHVIRYDNLEQLSYEDRIGDITHYRDSDIPGEIPDVREGEPYMMTINLLSRPVYSIYKDVFNMARGKPLAIMGEIRSLEKTIWKEQHMGARLIALVLGLSTWDDEGRKVLKKEAFIHKVVEICRIVKFPDYDDDPKCKAVKTLLQNEKASNGDDDALEDSPTVYPVASRKFREQMCAQNTREVRVMVMKGTHTQGEEYAEEEEKTE